MECNQIQEKLSAFIDNELDTDEMNAIKAHLIRCSHCRRARDRLEQMGQLMRNMAPLTTPSDFQFRLYSAIRRRETHRRRNPLFGWRAVFIPVTAMIFGIFIGLFSGNMLPGSNPVPIFTSETGSVSADGGMEARELFAALMHSEGVGSSLVYETDEADVIRGYNLDRYVHQPLVPVTVDTIPEADDPGNAGSANLSNSGTYYPSRQYVLDNVPMRVGYERTVY